MEGGDGTERVEPAEAAAVTPSPAETSVTQHFLLDSSDISAISVATESPAQRARRTGWAEISEEELLGESVAKMRRLETAMEVDNVAA